LWKAVSRAKLSFYMKSCKSQFYELSIAFWAQKAKHIF
jgi:hypothetical protein